MRHSPRALMVFLLAGVSCTLRPDAATGVSFTATSVSSLSVSLQPSSLSLSAGGSAVTIGTIRGARGLVESSVAGVPNGVSVRVTSATITDSVTTMKYIFTSNAAAPPGTYELTVRVTSPTHGNAAKPLTLVVTAVP